MLELLAVLNLYVAIGHGRYVNSVFFVCLTINKLNSIVFTSFERQSHLWWIFGRLEMDCFSCSLCVRIEGNVFLLFVNHFTLNRSAIVTDPSVYTWACGIHDRTVDVR